MKVYILYKKNCRALYAWTNSADDLKLFLSQRNSNSFNIEKVKMDDKSYQKFFDNYSMDNLVIEPFSCGKETVMMAVTMKELFAVNRRCEELDREMDTIYCDLVYRGGIFKNKYQKAIEYLTDIKYTSKSGLHSKVDDIKVLYEISKDTFI